MKSSLGHTLDLLRDTYNYNHWVYSLLRPHISGAVLEIGAGVGNLTRFLLGCSRVLCVEPDEDFSAALAELAKTHSNLRVLRTSLEALSEADRQGQPCDTVICVNVLEHIENDEDAVRKMLGLLSPGGRLLLYVPACPSAYGTLDATLQHRRRYSRRGLRALAARAGGQVLLCRYVNLLGLAGWWWTARILRQKRIDVRKARTMDRLVPFVSALERLIPPPVGQSLFTVVRSVPPTPPSRALS